MEIHIFDTYEEFTEWVKAQSFEKPISGQFKIDGDYYNGYDAVLDYFIPLEGVCPDCGEKIGTNDDCFTCWDWARESEDEHRLDIASGK
jgi:hypothetical protein